MYKIKFDYGELMVKFSIRLPLFRHIIRLINKMVDDGYIYFRSDNMTFDSMDGSHIGLVYAKIMKDLFNTYEFPSDIRQLCIWLNFEQLRRIVDKIPYRKTTKKVIGKNEVVDFEIYEKGIRVILNDKKGSLYLKVVDPDAEKDINAEKESLANIESDYEFEVNSVDFYDYLNLVDIFSEVITIGTYKGKMYVYTKYDNDGFEQEIVEEPHQNGR